MTLGIEIPHIEHFLTKLTIPILISQLENHEKILEVATCLYVKKDLTLDLNPCTFSSIYNTAKRFPWYLIRSFIIIPAYILCYSLFRSEDQISYLELEEKRFSKTGA